jgi:hypothetical protein
MKSAASQEAGVIYSVRFLRILLCQIDKFTLDAVSMLQPTSFVLQLELLYASCLYDVYPHLQLTIDYSATSSLVHP